MKKDKELMLAYQTKVISTEAKKKAFEIQSNVVVLQKGAIVEINKYGEIVRQLGTISKKTRTIQKRTFALT